MLPAVWTAITCSGIRYLRTPTLPLLTNVDSAYYKAGKVKITVDNEAVVKNRKRLFADIETG